MAPADLRDSLRAAVASLGGGGESVVVAGADDLAIIAVNPAAQELLGDAPRGGDRGGHHDDGHQVVAVPGGQRGTPHDERDHDQIEERDLDRHHGVAAQSDAVVRLPGGGLAIGDPFGGRVECEDFKLYVSLFSEDLPAALLPSGVPGDYDIIPGGPREFYIVGYRKPDGTYSAGALLNLEKKLPKGQLVTSRNWNTILKAVA